VGRRRRGSQGRAEGRVRGRVRERVQGRSQGGRSQGRSTRGGGGTGRNLGNFDVGEIQGYANRLKGQLGGSSGSGSGLSGGGSGLSAAASGLAGAASGLAGGSLAQRLTGSGTGGSDEELRNEVMERLDLMDERLRRLEDEMSQVRGGGAPGDLSEPPEGPEQETSP
jgi:hypothetical protein